MQDIHVVYHNDSGIAFRWKKAQKNQRTQLVFKDIGLWFTPNEIQQLSCCIDQTLAASKACGPCKQPCGQENNLLLTTPIGQLSLSVTFSELLAFEDLVRGTLFQMELDGLLNSLLD